MIHLTRLPSPVHSSQPTTMKTSLLLGLSLLLVGTSSLRANPDISTVIEREYGAATAEGIVLLQSSPTAADPAQWTVYARDPFRSGELVRSSLTLTNNSWAPKADGAGGNLLGRIPPQAIPFDRMRFLTSDARRIAQNNAALAKVNFVSVQYQLAANSTTSAPEWGLALLDINGDEVGFVVISAETGAVLHQQWGNNYAGPNADLPPPGSKGERAADDVKATARNAWKWSSDSGREVGRFFKRLFKN